MVDAAGYEFETILLLAVFPVVMVLPSLEMDILYYSTPLTPPQWGTPFSTPLRGISTFTKFILTPFSTRLRGEKQEMNF